MASEEQDGRGEADGGGHGQADASHGSGECMPCRGSGRVVSNLGGSANEVTCPWCGGEGTRQVGIDAQAKWLGTGGEGASADAAA